MRTTYLRSSDQRHLCFNELEWVSKTNGRLTGVSKRVSRDKLPVTDFNFYVVITTDTAATLHESSGLVCFQYAPSVEEAVVRIATSFISPALAELSLQRELPESAGFDLVAASSRREWNALLSRVDVVDATPLSEDTSKHLTVLYTGLYRALSFPRRLDELDLSGQVVHYSPYHPMGGAHAGPSVTDNGFWDTFRTVYPLLSLLFPDKLGPIVQGWLSAFEEGGWLPSWASPGYRNCMVGTFADVVIADAIVKNVKGFDLRTAMEALRTGLRHNRTPPLDVAYSCLCLDSFTKPPEFAAGAIGKHGLDEYVSKGYIASNSGSGGDYVSRTLDFAFADWACANAFEHLAQDSAFASDKERLGEDAKVLRARSARAVGSLFSAQHGLMVPKNDQGYFVPSFSDIEWGNGYTEGNAWHHSFPPFAIEQLVTLHGSRTNLLKKLNHLVKMPSNFRPGSYGFEIHEMKEGRAVAMGQYGHNNQPSHHILYMFALLGDRESTETYVRVIMDRAFGRDFYAGDEDNGEQGAWFVLSALGLYSVAPGSPDYVIGSPLFRHVRISRFDSAGNEIEPLHIVAQATNKTTVHVDKVLFNGEAAVGPMLSDYDLQKGGIVQFMMRDSVEEVLNLESLLRADSSMNKAEDSTGKEDTLDGEDSLWREKYDSLKGTLLVCALLLSYHNFVTPVEEEINLQHQIMYLQHKLNPMYTLPPAANAIASAGRSADTDRDYTVMCFLLIVLLAVGSAIGIQHLRRMGSQKNGQFKSSVHSV